MNEILIDTFEYLASLPDGTKLKEHGKYGVKEMRKGHTIDNTVELIYSIGGFKDESFDLTCEHYNKVLLRGDSKLYYVNEQYFDEDIFKI
jgi:hypothetical protein